MEKRWLLLALILLVPIVYGAGTVPITITTSPLDGASSTDSTESFAYTVYNDENTKQCELWSNFNGDIDGWSRNSTNQTTVINGFSNTITVNNIPDGGYRWNVKCFDPVTSVFNQWSYANKSAFTDRFDYTAGLINNTTPNWIPQYPQARWVNITPWKTMRIDAIAEFQGDRDIHAELNVSQIPITSRNIVVQYQYNVSQCNSTFKLTQGINPIGSAVYLNYYDGNNFLDVEFKVNSNTTLCNGGLSQVSVNKRIGGVTYSLVPFTQVWFITNRTYNVRVELATHNSTNYNMTVWFNGSVIASTTNISHAEVFDGTVILENAGTVTDFDNVTVAIISDYGLNIDAIDECTFFENLGNDLIMLFFTLAVLSLVILYSGIRGGFTAMSVNEVLIMFLIVVLGAVFSGTIADLIAGSCV
jgi:hypothetical protein